MKDPLKALDELFDRLAERGDITPAQAQKGKDKVATARQRKTVKPDKR
jgi:hypothetical protein